MYLTIVNFLKLCLPVKLEKYTLPVIYKKEFETKGKLPNLATKKMQRYKITFVNNNSINDNSLYKAIYYKGLPYR